MQNCSPTSDFGLGKSLGIRCASHVALEAVHVDLRRARVRLVTPKQRRSAMLDTPLEKILPEESAGALAVGARRHVARDLEIRMHGPYASLVDREYDEVLRLDFPGVGLVRDSKRATAGVVYTRGVELREGLVGAWVVRLSRVERIAAERVVRQELTVRNGNKGTYPGADSQ